LFTVNILQQASLSNDCGKLNNLFIISKSQNLAQHKKYACKLEIKANKNGIGGKNDNFERGKMNVWINTALDGKIKT
jgi:hypothetical protein